MRYEIFDAAPGRNYSEADSSILAYNYIFSYDKREAFKKIPALTVINNQQLFDGKIEIWYYDRQRGQKEIPGILRQHDDSRMFFVFADQSGNGIIRQVFSTELYEF